jgi:broad specificity phosphatase PhoE
MAKLELILIRHGETDWNSHRIFRGQEDVRLNANGIAQADAVAEALKDKVLEAIYSSPLKRAYVTAKRIAVPHEMEIRTKAGIVDVSFGVWQGKTEQQVMESDPKLHQKWLERPYKVRFPRGESMKKAWKRVNTAVREILMLHGVGTVVIVTHRIPLKLMTTYLLGKHLDEFQKVRHDPCAMSVFQIEGQAHVPIVLNDTRHLAKLNLPKPSDF